jgi:hypothetical protein
MRNYPTITTGLGKFTPDLFTRLMTMLRAFEESPAGVGQVQGMKSRAKQTIILGKITATGSSVSTNRFKYTVTEQAMGDFDSSSGTFTFTDKTGGFQDIQAFNTVEIANTSSFAGPGVDLSAADFPAGMSLQPVFTNTVAVCLVKRDVNGEPIALFTIANAIDGSCT